MGGALCEVGWEISDSLQRLHQITCGGEEGKAKNPASLLVLFAMHHSCAQCLVMPMNIFYPDNAYYHEGIFLLQGAAAAAGLLQQYGYTVDITTQKGLTQMRIQTSIVLGTMIWGRVLRYGYLWWKLFSNVREDGNSFVLKLAAPPVVLLSLFNIA